MAYLLPNGATSLIDIDGDEFSMNDYGLLLDVSPQAQQQAQNLFNLANNALAGNKLSFSLHGRYAKSLHFCEWNGFVLIYFNSVWVVFEIALCSVGCVFIGR